MSAPCLHHPTIALVKHNNSLYYIAYQVYALPYALLGKEGRLEVEAVSGVVDRSKYLMDTEWISLDTEWISLNTEWILNGY